MGDYAKALGGKLRAIRQQQGLSLHGVEQKSGGRWKAVVVGSYERGDRAVTVQKLAELADFYGVPVAELLPEGRVPSGSEPATKIVINLERLQQLPADKVGPLARYAAAIQSQRGDYNGKVLSIRSEDLRSLSIIYDKTPGELTDQLIEWGVLPPEASARHAAWKERGRRACSARRAEVLGDVGDPAEHAVEEARAVVGGQRAGQLDGFGDRHRVVDLVDPQQLEHADAQQRAVDRGHAGHRPAFGVLGEQLVDALPVRRHAFDQHRRVVGDRGASSVSRRWVSTAMGSSPRASDSNRMSRARFRARARSPGSSQETRPR